MLIRRLCLALLLSTTNAVFLDEAYQLDFHYTLLGAPIANTTFFHQPNPVSKASLLYILSEKSVVGAVNPKDGQIVWRQVSTPSEDGPGILRAGEGSDVVLSSTGPRVNAWSAADGRLAWQKTFRSEVVKDLAISDGTGRMQREVFMAGKGNRTTVRKLDITSGSAMWTYEDTSGDEPYRIISSQDNLFLVSLHLANGPIFKDSYIKVTKLDPETGTSISEFKLDSNLNSKDDIVPVIESTGVPFVAWMDSKSKSLKTNILGSKDVQKHDLKSENIENVEIHATGSHALLSYHTTNSHSAEIFAVDGKTNTFKKVRSLSSATGHASFSATTVSGEDYFTLITDKEVILESPGRRIQSWPIQGLEIPGLIGTPYPVHSTSEVVVKSGPTYAIRSAIFFSSGDWVLIRNGETGWYRPEALSGVIRAAWADLTDWAEEITVEEVGHPISTFVHRLQRQANDLKKLRDWSSIVDGLVARFTQQAPPTAGLGLDKTIVLATENGRLVALDMAQKGRVIWNILGKRTDQVYSSCTPELPWTAESLPSIRDVLSCLGELPGLIAEPSWLSSTSFANPRLNIDESTRDAVRTAVRMETAYVFKNGNLYGTKDESGKDAWNFSPYKGFKIHSVTPPSLLDEPVAAIGKVLGDRSVLYKYLNPNAIAVITVNDDRKMAAVHLIDAVSGNILYTSNHINVDTSRPVASAVSEHWLAFSYTTDSPDDSVSKGYQLVMTEFYESDVPNDRGLYGSLANFSTTDPRMPAANPFALTQSFHVPEEISLMAVTQTTQGITSRQLLVGIPYSNSIVGIPSQLLDPRRLVGKDPTQEQMMEGLSRYSPMIDFDPRWYLNHREEIAGLKKIMTTPAQLESTSLVFAYGIDLFGTRVTPSFAFDILGKSFNKIQLVLTVVALLVGVFGVAPLIQRKQTNALWQ